MENTKNGTKPADCRRKNAAAETIIIEQNGKSVRSTAARISKAYECNAYSGGVRLNGGTCSDRVF